MGQLFDIIEPWSCMFMFYYYSDWILFSCNRFLVLNFISIIWSLEIKANSIRMRILCCVFLLRFDSMLFVCTWPCMILLVGIRIETSDEELRSLILWHVFIRNHLVYFMSNWWLIKHHRKLLHVFVCQLIFWKHCQVAWRNVLTCCSSSQIYKGSIKCLLIYTN